MPSEQPRGEEARVGGRIQEGALSAVRTPTNPPVESRLVPLAPPRGEGDDLAARLEDLASWLEPDSPFHGTIREAAQLARASTHPEQSERVDLEWAFRLMRDCLQAGKEPEDDEQDRLDDIADAMIRPAQTEQGGKGEVS